MLFHVTSCPFALTFIDLFHFIVRESISDEYSCSPVENNYFSLYALKIKEFF